MNTHRRLASLVCATVLAAAIGGCTQPPKVTGGSSAAEGSSTPSAAVDATAITPPPTQEPTAAVSPMKVLAPDHGAWTGVFSPPVPFKIGSLDDYAEITGETPAIVMWYQPWHKSGADEFFGAECIALMRRGVVPLITWEPWNPSSDPNYLKHPEKQPKYRLSKIVDGDYDSYIRSWARQIATLGGPVMLRPMHEMNGTWYPWGGTVNGNSPDDFIAAWRHIHDIFAEEGADNVTWVWSVNNNNIPDEDGNRWGDYYPGADYVDWVASSGFNWGTSRPKHRWKSFDEVFGNAHAYLSTLGKPILLSEFATVSKGGDKPAWIRDAYRAIRQDYPGIAAVVYYDNGEQGLKGKQDWAIASTKGSAKAYAEAVSAPFFRHAPIPALETWLAGKSDADFDKLKKKLREGE